MSEQVISPASNSIAKLGECYNKTINNGYVLRFEGDVITKNYHIFHNYNLFPSSWGSSADAKSEVNVYTNTSGYTPVDYYYRFVICLFGEYSFGVMGNNNYPWTSTATKSYPTLAEVRPTYSSDIFYPTTAYSSRIEVSGITDGCSLWARIIRSVRISRTFTTVTSASYSMSVYAGPGDKTVTAEDYNNAGCMHLGGEGGGSNLFYGATITDTNRHRVKHWLMNGAVVSGSETKTEISPTLPYADTVITCVVEQYRWSFTAKSSADDSIGVVSGAVTDTFKESGEQIPLEAICQDTANYRFVGWYRGYGANLDADACIERISTDAAFSYAMGESDVTIVAKFASRKTTLVVDTTGSGTFDLTINKTPIGVGLTEYTDEDARDGWEVLVSATPSDRYFFSHWLIPNGETTTTNVYEATTSLYLPTRAENKLTANFIEKVVVPITGSISGNGIVTFSGDLSEGGVFDSETGKTTSDTYIETPYALVATPNSKLYAFDKWQYLVGDAWADMDASSFPSNWIQSINDNIAIVYVKNGTASDTHSIRAVFKKLNTYTIEDISIEGSHPINQNLASDGGCSYAGLPEADEIGEGGESRWLEGTQISLSPIAGAKWVYDKAVGVMVVGTEEVELDSLNFVLNGDVKALQIHFKARTYRVETLVSNASSNVGYATFEYYINASETLVVDEADDVYVDTPITIRANTKDGLSSSDVAFYDWSLNGVAMPYTAEQTIAAVTENMTFTAQFAVRHTFQYDGSKVVNDKTYYFGKVNVSYERNGVAGYPLELPAEGTSVDLMLRCGSSLALIATALKVDEGTVQLQGFFTGWSELINGTWTPVTGWTESVETTATTPRSIKASFSDSEIWPILRLRNFAETQDFCNFSVSGVLEDRQQTIGDEVIQLTNEYDFFCKPFSTIHISLIKTSETRRFIRWQRFSFNLTDESSEVVEDADFSDVQDLSFVITNDTSLRPEFYTGGAVPVPVSFTNGSETFGNVAIEGDYVSINENGHKEFIQGDEITLVASPNNGYKFVGWYANQYGTGTPLSESSFYTIKVGSSMTWYYAKFEQDANAIYKFGVSTEPKQAHWSSKRIMVNTPISFSTAQVDAEGYEGMTLEVYHSSSPDKPTKHEAYEIKSSNSRRLQTGRPEKLFEFSIKSTTPINFMAFSTSVTGLIGGA